LKRKDDKEESWIRNPELKDKLIQKMVLLLREGHRMLDETCPRCGAILFLRKDVGLRYCPNCEVFLATPEELKRIDKSRIKVIGEVGGGEIVEFKEKPRVGNKTIEERAYTGKEKPRFPTSEMEDIDKLLELLVKRILDQISYTLEFEIRRLSIKDLLEILRLLLEIRRLL